MLPCDLKKAYTGDGGEGGKGGDDDKGKGGGDEGDRRKLLSLAENMIWRRVLAAPSGDSTSCPYVRNYVLTS